MFREKLIATLFWSAMTIAAALAADFLITIVIFGAWEAYTPFITLAIASLVTIPVSYGLVSSRIDLRHARDELAAARDAAVSADKTKTQFFSNMSHELRTPLNAIIGFSEMLASDVFAAKRVEYAHLINNSGKHLLSLVNDLLDLSRIEAGKLDLKLETVDMEEIVTDCAGTVATRAREREVRVVRTVAPLLPLVTADRRAITQILLNLLTNAIKFSSAGGVVEVFARLEASGEICLGVRDEGIGIAPEDQARMFERFGQARHDVTGIEKGTGLGLPIVKGLAEAHGGRVAMNSQLGEGTCVLVWLPRERVVERAAIALAS